MLCVLFSCKKENTFDCFKSNGPDVTEVRYPGTFDMIFVTDKFEVEIFNGNECKVEIICGKNIIKNISSAVEGRTLTLNNNNKCNFVRGYKRQIKINVTLPHIMYLENIGVGLVKVNESYTQDSISVRVSSSGDVVLAGTYNKIKTSSNGNGDMYVKGSTNYLYVYTNGINFVNTEELRVRDYMFIHNVSIGDCSVNADGTKVLDYNIQKEGNIYYSGTPLLIQNYSEPEATGQIIKK